MNIAGKDYPVVGYAEHKTLGARPIVDIPMTSDYQWQLGCLRSRLEYPELYRDMLGEDADKEIACLRQWLIEHGATEEALS